jgi:ketosteroid isomerase-like protein
MDQVDVEQQLEALRGRVRSVEDIEEIRRLRMKYHYLINEGLLDRAAEIYTEDAYVVWSSFGAARGHKEIVALFKSLPADFVKHFVSNHIVDVIGDEATGVAYVDARYANEGQSYFIAGKYDERYRRTDDGWRISETVLVTYFKATPQEGWAAMVNSFPRNHQ